MLRRSKVSHSPRDADLEQATLDFQKWNAFFAFNYAGLGNCLQYTNIQENMFVLDWVIKRCARGAENQSGLYDFRSLALFPNNSLLRQLLLLEKVNETCFFVSH
jgi:hypothetical protein